MIFFARRNFPLDNMAVKKNARYEIAETLKMLRGGFWELLGREKRDSGLINKNPRLKAWATV